MDYRQTYYSFHLAAASSRVFGEAAPNMNVAY
jgi:hypothetical protein